MSSSIPYFGEALSLLSAGLWALAVIFFRKSGEKVHPLALNTFKNLLAFILFIPTIWIFREKLLYPAPLNTYLLLILSGIVGIAIGDSLLFASLNKLGAGLTGIVVCMYSPFIICLSVIFLGETLTIRQILGAILIIAAVMITTIKKEKKIFDHKQLLIGIFFGILASAGMAVGVIIMKPIINKTPLLWATEIRLLGGIIALGLIFLFYPRRRRLTDSLLMTNKWSYTISGSLIGAYLAMAVWLGGMKYTQASVASALNQTSTIFIFIFAGIILKEPLNLKHVISIIMAFIGTLLVSFS
jgi:drug/metabolite transporter (DMT)-like permease